ncbi:hypothetical protein AB6C81_18875 [Vibrio splendidus]
MKSLKVIDNYIHEIKQVEPVDITDELLKHMPKLRGVYMFLNINTGLVDYVGVSNHLKGGLKHRLHTQHLTPSYRQSSFRIKLVKEFGLDERKESVDHIKTNYKLIYLARPEAKSIILAVEQVLICEHKSKYNAETKHNF